MDLFHFEQASSQNLGINPSPNYDFTAVSPTTTESDMMFASHRNSPPTHVNPGNMWNGPGALDGGLGKLLNNYSGQVNQAFGQVTPPDDFDMHGFSNKRADSGIASTMGMNPASSLSPRSSVSSKTRAAIHRTSNRNRRESRSSDGDGPGDPKKEKYREKNRVAAAKCRAKKKEHVDQLEDNHRTQSALNTALKQTEKSLRDELSFWRTQALQHTFCNCHSIQDYNMRKAQSLTAASGFGANLSSASHTFSNARSSSTSFSGGPSGFRSHSSSCPEASSPALSNSSRASIAQPGGNAEFRRLGKGSQDASPAMHSGVPPFSISEPERLKNFVNELSN